MKTIMAIMTMPAMTSLRPGGPGMMMMMTTMMMMTKMMMTDLEGSRDDDTIQGWSWS